jgi:ABC-type sugar transport system ATPase subunit
MGPIVELKTISKFFSGVRVLSKISLSVDRGECLGLVGENGAGKSTLMKILSGVLPYGDFEGQILLEGRVQKFSGPRAGQKAGVAMIHQDLSLFGELSVAENIFISDFPATFGVVNREIFFKKAEVLLKKFNVSIDPEDLVKDLSAGKRQLVEIARALIHDLKVLILDEPTSALSEQEAQSLFQLVEELKGRGVACIFISHKPSEIRKLCERIMVLRDGSATAQFSGPEWSDEELFEVMVGKRLESIYPPKRVFSSDREVILKVENLNYLDSETRHPILKGVSFDLKGGEVLGISGLRGSRRTELLLALFGCLEAEKISGQLVLEGKEVELKSPLDAIEHGLALVTEDRDATGIIPDMDLRGNLTLPILRRLSRLGVVREIDELELVRYYCKLLRIHAPDEAFKARNLSGGNQQKLLLARWLSTQPKILLLDEPTRGIDVVAKAEIYHLIRQLVDQGLTIILVSSELQEVVKLADRVLVMKEGSVVEILEDASITPVAILAKAAA